jgi:hypothetical protein
MDEERLTRNYTWEPVAALACFVGAGLSLVMGFVLTTGWVVNAQRHPFLHGVGLTLLILGLPILILGGHCLDLNDRKAKKANAELHVHRNGGTKSLHVVVMLVGSVFLLCIAPCRLNGQEVGPVQSGEAITTETETRAKDESATIAQDSSSATAKTSLAMPHLYKLFMNSLRTFNVRRRNLLLLTICLPKLLTVVALERGSAGEPTVSVI